MLLSQSSRLFAIPFAALCVAFTVAPTDSLAAKSRTERYEMRPVDRAPKAVTQPARQFSPPPTTYKRIGQPRTETPPPSRNTRPGRDDTPRKPGRFEP